MKRAAIILGKILLGMLSFVLCILLFVSSLATILIADAGTLVSQNGMQTLIMQLLSPGTSGGDAENGAELTTAVVEWAYDSLVQEYGDKIPVEMEELKDLIENSTIKEFVAEKTASLVNDLYTGESNTTITEEDVSELLTENAEAIRACFPQVKLDTPEDIEKLTEKIMEHPLMKQIMEEGISSVLGIDMEDLKDPDKIEDLQGSISSGKLPQKHIGSRHIVAGAAFLPVANIAANPIAHALEIVRMVTSPTTLLLSIGICVALVVLLFLCAWNRPYNAMLESGITFLLTGTIFLVPTLIAWLMPGAWMTLFSFLPLVGTLTREVLLLTGGICGGVAGLGLALIIGSCILRHFMKKKRAAKAAPVVIPQAIPEQTPEA